MASVTLTNVRKSYGSHPVIHGVDLAIEDGEFVVIVGPSGCGKSTLLRMVAGLEDITSGEIEINGTRVNGLEPKNRDIAMVFQNYALYPHMTVYQNLAYGLRMHHLPKPEIAERVNWAAGILQLGELLARRPGQLSGGQRQRVAMGRAMVRRPAAFLFDEPLSNLDAKLRVQMRLEIKRLQRELKTTSLYVTHDQVEAMTMADRLVVMNGGIAEQVGTPLDIYQKPRTMFVGGFIGSPTMNFLKGHISNGRFVLENADGQSLPLPPHTQAEDGRSLVLGLRPEHINLAADGQTPDTVLALDLVEPLGADTLLYGTIGGKAGQSLTVRLRGTQRLQGGETIPLSVVPGYAHLFDPESGLRLGA